MSTHQQPEHLTRYQKKTLHAVINARTLDDLRTRLDVTPATLKRWLKNKTFRDELIQHIEIARQVSDVFLASSLPAAAARLNGLLDAQNPETSRKVCADLLNRLDPPRKTPTPKPPAAPITVTDPVESARLYKLHGVDDPIADPDNDKPNKTDNA